MPSTPAITTGMMLRITSPGFITPMDEIPTPDLAVPYAAPMSSQDDDKRNKNHTWRRHRHGHETGGSTGKVEVRSWTLGSKRNVKGGGGGDVHLLTTDGDCWTLV